MSEAIASANEAYGQLKANLFSAGFHLERAFRSFLEPLLAGDDWKLCGTGFDDVNAFMDSLRLDKFRVIAKERKAIVLRIKELQPAVSNRQIARTLGLGHDTVDRDLGRGADAPATDENSRDRETNNGANAPFVTMTGRQAAVTINRREHNAHPRTHVLRACDFPEGRYPILLVDPPWCYENPPMGGGNRAIDNHYPTMPLEEICALPIANIATENALLYMWDTAAKTRRSKASVEADATRAKRIPNVGQLAGTSLDNGEELDALGKLPPDQQATLIDRAKTGENVTARTEPQPPDERQRLWRMFVIVLNGDPERAEYLAQHFATPDHWIAGHDDLENAVDSDLATAYEIVCDDGDPGLSHMRGNLVTDRKYALVCMARCATNSCRSGFCRN
jgi:hypothetical protein